MSQHKQVSKFLAVMWKANLRGLFFLLQKKQQSVFRWALPLTQLKLQTGPSLILPSKHKTTRSPIKQKKARISFVGCQQCTIYISEELTQNEAEFQGKASLRWSPVFKLTQSILLTTCLHLLQEVENPIWVVFRVLAGPHLQKSPMFPVLSPGLVTEQPHSCFQGLHKRILRLLLITNLEGPTPRGKSLGPSIRNPHPKGDDSRAQSLSNTEGPDDNSSFGGLEASTSVLCSN